jgi:antitoxin VapB
MVRATVFQSNRSQAVRRPKDIAFPEGVKQVRALREEKRRAIVPAEAVWDDFFDSPGVDLGIRDHSTSEDRESL